MYRLRDVTKFVSDCSEITVEAVEKIVEMLHFVEVLGLFVMIIIVLKSALLTKYPKVVLNDYCSCVFCNHFVLCKESADDALDSCGRVMILMLLFLMRIVGDNGSIVVKKISPFSLPCFEIIVYFRLMFLHHHNEFIVGVSDS